MTDYTAALAQLDLPALVHSKFRLAQESNELTFYSTQVHVVDCKGIPVSPFYPPTRLAFHRPLTYKQFQIRFSPALANKPKPDGPSSRSDGPRFDPFEKPSASLLVASLLNHNLVLNKFPIIPDHFIIATKEYKLQTDLLEEDDLAVAYGCLRAWRQSGEELFSFFNSGEHSGASQLHRHIQFLPVISMSSGTRTGDWDILISYLEGLSPGMLCYFMQRFQSILTAFQRSTFHLLLCCSSRGFSS
jgi:ATP adenylyltransferase